MNFVDRTKLQIEMVKNDFSIKDISKEMYCTYQCAYNKIKKNRDFSETELCILSRLFGKTIFIIDDIGIKKDKNNARKRKSE